MKHLNIQIRISEEMKNQFYKKCEDNGNVPSAVLRKFISEYIKDGNNVFKK